MGLYHLCLVSTLILITKYTCLYTNISRFLVILSLLFIFYPQIHLTFIRLSALYGQCLISCSLTVYQKVSLVCHWSQGDYFLFRFFRGYMWVWRDVSGIFSISIVHFKCDIYTLTKIFSGVPHIG